MTLPLWQQDPFCCQSDIAGHEPRGATRLNSIASCSLTLPARGKNYIPAAFPEVTSRNCG